MTERFVQYGLPRDPEAFAAFVERLRAAIRYNYRTGQMTWKAAAATTHKARKGKVGHQRKDGAIIVTFEGRRIYGQHVAWAHYHGALPEGNLLPRGSKSWLAIHNWEESVNDLSDNFDAIYARDLRAWYREQKEKARGQ